MCDLPDKVLEDVLEHGVVGPRHPLQEFLDLQEAHRAVWHHGDLLQVPHVLGRQQRREALGSRGSDEGCHLGHFQFCQSNSLFRSYLMNLIWQRKCI